ncbi:MAG: uracil phosphoribosyltransferase, partial [Candidatus Actinomarina sp.]
MEIIEISHPLKDHYLTIIRDKDTNFENFREYSSKLSYLLFIEGTKNISTKSKTIETPLIKTEGLEIENENVAIAVLRAGLGLVDGVKNLLPDTSFGYIGVQRNEETATPE